MRFAELFAGAGGLSMGLERAGWSCVFHAEIADAPRAILSHRWPDVPLYGDVTTLNGMELVAAHGPFDLLTGGSPCQDLSVAGKRAGLDGSRSSLFFEQMRLWNETGADLCLWENVDGARSSNDGKDFGEVLRAFVGAAVAVPSDGWRSAGVAAGPTGVAAWRVLDAQFFGVPQRRRRVFVLGTRTGRIDPAEVLSLAEGLCGDSAPSGEAREGVAAAALAGTGEAIGGYGRVSCPVRGGGNSHADDHNVVVAFDTTQITTHSLTHEDVAADARTSAAFAWNEEVITNPQHRGGVTAERTSSITPGGRTCVAFNETGHEKWTVESVAESLNAHEAKEPHTIINALTSQLGPRDNNGAACVIGTLNGSQRQQVDGAMTTTAGIPRRLTPRECERLMGWPDDHTLVPDAKGNPLSDSARYKACGNGVASVVSHWIGWRLALALTESAA